jgi:signal transduction histidine kinase
MARAAKNLLLLASFVLGGPLTAAAVAVPARPAPGCANAELALCAASSNGSADDALWMLRRVVAAVRANKAEALREFSGGANGFRTLDLYVFCIGPDGRMSAHPDPTLLGQDARQLRDPTGHAFAAEMLDVAREGAIAEVHYLYPRPGSTVPEPKISFVTRTMDQVCGVGYYE